MANETETATGYIPGVCNIGKQEVIKRRWIAIAGLAMAVALAAALQFLQANQFLKLIIFIPLSIGIASFQQTWFKFCVAFGLLGIFRFDGNGDKIPEGQQAHYKADRAKALKIILSSILIAGKITVLFFLLPV